MPAISLPIQSPYIDCAYHNAKKPKLSETERSLELDQKATRSALPSSARAIYAIQRLRSRLSAGAYLLQSAHHRVTAEGCNWTGRTDVAGSVRSAGTDQITQGAGENAASKVQSSGHHLPVQRLSLGVLSSSSNSAGEEQALAGAPADRAGARQDQFQGNAAAALRRVSVFPSTASRAWRSMPRRRPPSVARTSRGQWWQPCCGAGRATGTADATPNAGCAGIAAAGPGAGRAAASAAVAGAVAAAAGTGQSAACQPGLPLDRLEGKSSTAR